MSNMGNILGAAVAGLSGARQPRDMDRIKDLLSEWAGWQVDGYLGGYPKQVAFATERVQTSNRSTDTFREMPEDVERLNGEIEKLPPAFRRIIALEYLDNRPQKTKAAILHMPRQVFSARLLWIYEQLTYSMWRVTWRVIQ